MNLPLVHVSGLQNSVCKINLPLIHVSGLQNSVCKMNCAGAMAHSDPPHYPLTSSLHQKNHSHMIQPTKDKLLSDNIPSTNYLFHPYQGMWGVSWPGVSFFGNYCMAINQSKHLLVLIGVSWNILHTQCMPKSLRYMAWHKERSQSFFRWRGNYFSISYFETIWRKVI